MNLLSYFILPIVISNWPFFDVCWSYRKTDLRPMVHQATNQCDVCDSWFHARCCKLPSIYIDILSRSSCTWLCPKCGRQNSKPYSSDSEVLPSSLNYFEPLFNSGILPSHSNESEPSKGNNNRGRSKGVLKNNRRKLTCMTMNCRSDPPIMINFAVKSG